MSSIKLKHSGGNGISIAAPSSNPAADRTITLNDNYAGDGSFVTADSSGNVGINKSNPSYPLVARLTGDSGLIAEFANSGGYGLTIGQNSATGEAYLRTGTGQDLAFVTNGGSGLANERMRINSSGRVLVGTNNPIANGVFEVVGNIGFNDCLVGYRRSNDDTSNRAFTRFQSSNGTQIGFIGMGSSSVSYNTSSDYRMKENVVAISDGITRLKTLKPSRFNFLSDTSTTLDGFLAHEVSSIVPEAITGEKDAVDSDNKPIYQGIDQSKLVPLLTAALQEAIAKIETLEAKVAALEAA